MGVYCLCSRVREHIPPGKPYGFDNLVLKMLGKGRAHHGYAAWRLLARYRSPDDYQKAIEDWPMLKAGLGL